MRKSKAAASAVLAAGLFFGGAGVAMAAGWQRVPDLESGGVKLSKGQYRFNPAGRNHGGFEWQGDLADVSPGDGNNVYVQVRVEGYSWNRFNGQQKKTVHLHKTVYDGAARYTSTAHIRACRDRGSLRPDNCSRTMHYKNK
ncbi:hypothetical protein [Streptomyces sp. NPDC002225]|uniref:hypothetical protein n=1 Tax=Streptomyces sp. NPDC002225 TaxID=3154413 RepID=UPI003328794D